MGILKFVSKLIVSLVFIFSGFVKIIDPLGTAYKLEDYFIPFGLEFLLPLTLVISFIMCGLEFLIGITLLLNIKVPSGSWIALIFMIIFTPVTLILAIFNPVQDCGCFGDAIILSNWETFLKNVILSIFVVILFFNRKDYTTIFSGGLQWFFLIVLCALTLGFELFNYRHLPMMDFRPYKVGNNIPDLMQYTDDYNPEIVLIYKNKAGKTAEFSIDNLPDEKEWTFVDQKSVKEPPEPPIHDFNIVDSNGNDITDYILESGNFTFLLISENLTESSIKYQTEINSIANYCTENRYDFLCLTSSLNDEIQRFRAKTAAPYEFYFTDRIPLKTIIRSNPGLVLIKNGTIISKWHNNDLPDLEDLENRFKNYVR